MKKFLLKLLTVFVPCFIFVVLFSIIVDPYNVFHYKNIRDNGVAPNKNYIKMRYILDTPDKFDAFLFGNSRVMAIDVDSIPLLHCYNMTYGRGYSKNHLENLEVMTEHGVIPSAVLLSVDGESCLVNNEKSNTALLYRPYPYPTGSLHDTCKYPQFLINYINPGVVSSLGVIIRHKSDTEAYQKQFYENGGRERTYQPPEFDWNKIPLSLQTQFKGYPIENRIDECITEIQKIINLCNKYNIKLIVFTNPLHIALHQYFMHYGYLDFLIKLSNITDYYNFSGINDVTVNNNYFEDLSHYNIAVGDLMIDAMFNGKTDETLLSQGFGFYVTKESRDRLFTILRQHRGIPRRIF